MKQKQKSMFTPKERSAILSLSAILAIRMLGLFIIIPVFSPYLQTLVNSTPMLIGITMGIYGLTQALLQIPFGILSDYLGRREVITLGLVIFMLGSLVAGFTHNIWLVMLGRAMQGAGAISGTVIALLSDLTSEQVRTKAMAVIGMSIGASFMFAFMFGPILSSILSVSNIFFLVAFMVLPILYLLWHKVPASSSGGSTGTSSQNSSYLSGFQNLKNLFEDKVIVRQLKIHAFGIFSLHGILMANFVAIPILFKQLGLTSYEQGLTYIEVFLVAILFMVPMIIIAEKKQQQKNILFLSVILLILSEVAFWLFFNKFWGITLGLVMFFIGFNVLEASLPSIVSKLAPKQVKGAVLGMYSTAQFLGPMLGGVLAGVLFKSYGLKYVFLLGVFWSIIWLMYLPKVKFNINSSLHSTEVSSTVS